jgi:hypothetical protein
VKLFKSVAVTVAALSALALGIGSAFAQETKYDWKACQSDIEKLCKDAKGDEKIWSCLEQYDSKLSRACDAVHTKYEVITGKKK